MTSARRKDRAKGSALHGPVPRDHPVHGLTAAVLVIIMMAGMLAGPQLAIPSITEEADASANPIPIAWDKFNDPDSNRLQGVVPYHGGSC